MKKEFEEIDLDSEMMDEASMDAYDLMDEMQYPGMERSARRILVEEKLAPAEEVALMTKLDICKKLLEFCVVVACEDEDIIIIKKEDMTTFEKIARHLKK